MVQRYWKQFNLVTQNHFYHSGAKIENRRSIVEALVFKFDAKVGKHTHDIRSAAEQRTISVLDKVKPYPPIALGIC